MNKQTRRAFTGWIRNLISDYDLYPSIEIDRYFVSGFTSLRCVLEIWGNEIVIEVLKDPKRNNFNVYREQDGDESAPQNIDMLFDRLIMVVKTNIEKIYNEMNKYL